MTPALLLLFGCTTPPPPLLVLAPGSTQVPVDRLVRDWAASQQTEAIVVFDDSAALARMVDGGTPADLLLLTDPGRMDGLADRQHLSPTSRVALAGDDLAVVTSIVATRVPRDVGALAAQTGPVWLPPADTAEADAVEQLLTASGDWPDLEGRIQHAHDETALMEAVEADPLATGLLAAGRANLGVNVAVAFALSPPEPPLLLEAAVVAHAERPETAGTLLAFLQTPEAEAPFRARGFRGLGEPRPASGSGAPPGATLPPPGPLHPGAGPPPPGGQMQPGGPVPPPPGSPHPAAPPPAAATPPHAGAPHTPGPTPAGAPGPAGPTLPRPQAAEK